MGLCCCLGKAASIAQLAGVDASGLISTIVQAALTVRWNNEECQRLARRAEMIGGLLQRLQGSKMAEHPDTWMPLQGLEETLLQAKELVASCQRSGCAYRFCMGWLRAHQFRGVQNEMDNYLCYLTSLFQTITYDDHMRLLREILDATRQEGAQVTLGSVTSHSERNIARSIDREVVDQARPVPVPSSADQSPCQPAPPTSPRAG